jgi:hypothetical protein
VAHRFVVGIQAGIKKFAHPRFHKIGQLPRYYHDWLFLRYHSLDVLAPPHRDASKRGGTAILQPSLTDIAETENPRSERSKDEP